MATAFLKTLRNMVGYFLCEYGGLCFCTGQVSPVRVRVITWAVGGWPQLLLTKTATASAAVDSTVRSVRNPLPAPPRRTFKNSPHPPSTTAEAESSKYYSCRFYNYQLFTNSVRMLVVAAAAVVYAFCSCGILRALSVAVCCVFCGGYFVPAHRAIGYIPLGQLK